MTEHMQPHCVGRYLIDLPKGFALSTDSAGYFFIGLNFDQDLLQIGPGPYGLSPQQFKAWVQGQISKWDAPKEHVEPGEPPTRLAKAIDYGDEALLHTRSHDSDDKSVTLRYLGFSEGTAFELSRSANADEAKIARSTDRLLALAKRISRIQDPLKSGKGTCFDELLISGAYDEEQLDMYFTSEAHPGLRIRVYFGGIQEDDKEDIFQRGRTAMNLFGATVPTLLTRSYAFNGMTANEDGFSTPSEIDNGRSNYAYQFETRRSDGSIKRPLIRVVLDAGVYKDGKQIGIDMTQGEVKGLWEATIKTLRPRPGAV